MRIFLVLIQMIWLFLLTVLTQVGGLIWLLNRAFWLKGKSIKGRWAWRSLSFGLLYFFSAIVLIPLLARLNGRVALPLGTRSERPVAPLSGWTCLSNRHYVTPALYELAIRQGRFLQKLDAKQHLVYLDANFPFGKNFPLFPHLSHGDGRKLDLAFFRYDTREQKSTTQYPSFMGYGFSEPPAEGELNQPEICAQRGAWQYSLLQTWVKADTKRYPFDVELNTQLLQNLSDDPATEKIFVEPHLKGRLGLGRLNNIRYHGCQAVRHDDHIHVQVK